MYLVDLRTTYYMFKNIVIYMIEANSLHISEIYDTKSVIFFNSAHYSQKIINNNINKLISLTIIPLIILLRRCVGYAYK